MVAWDQYAADVGVVFPPSGEDKVEQNVPNFFENGY